SRPLRCYGPLSSKRNPGELAKRDHAAMLRKLGETCLHANELGLSRLSRLAPALIRLQKRFDFRFDYWYMHKPTYALSTLFEAIFDFERNQALKWEKDRAPLALPVFREFSLLCDENVLKKAWSLRNAKDIVRRGGEIAALMKELHERSKASDMDPGTGALFDAALGFGIWRPQALDFGSSDKKMHAPNAVGFQFVLSAIARRLREAKRKDALSIKADRQSEFNAAQASAHDVLKRYSDALAALGAKEQRRFVSQPFFESVDAEDALRKRMPGREIEFVPSESSVGLQIVDIYLWIMRRARSGTVITGELKDLRRLVSKHVCIESISREGIEAGWTELQKKLPAYGGPAMH
ncbi:MAG: DUF3800 domain-containing protein, partial [Rhodospirillaceae bacterium]|nr:DUF3800 domain-containing protein [Rhodospirillaceae bacterium]